MTWKTLVFVLWCTRPPFMMRYVPAPAMKNIYVSREQGSKSFLNVNILSDIRGHTRFLSFTKDTWPYRRNDLELFFSSALGVADRNDFS